MRTVWVCFFYQILLIARWQQTNKASHQNQILIPCLVFSCCVTTHDEKLPLVGAFAQTGICLMERHAPVVFTN